MAIVDDFGNVHGARGAETPDQMRKRIFAENATRQQAARNAAGVTDDMLSRANKFGSGVSQTASEAASTVRNGLGRAAESISGMGNKLRSVGMPTAAGAAKFLAKGNLALAPVVGGLMSLNDTDQEIREKTGFSGGVGKTLNVLSNIGDAATWGVAGATGRGLSRVMNGGDFFDFSESPTASVTPAVTQPAVTQPATQAAAAPAVAAQGRQNFDQRMWADRTGAVQNAAGSDVVARGNATLRQMAADPATLNAFNQVQEGRSSSIRASVGPNGEKLFSGVGTGQDTRTAEQIANGNRMDAETAAWHAEKQRQADVDKAVSLIAAADAGDPTALAQAAGIAAKYKGVREAKNRGLKERELNIDASYKGGQLQSQLMQRMVDMQRLGMEMDDKRGKDLMESLKAPPIRTVDKDGKVSFVEDTKGTYDIQQALRSRFGDDYLAKINSMPFAQRQEAIAAATNANNLRVEANDYQRGTWRGVESNALPDGVSVRPWQGKDFQFWKPGTPSLADAAMATLPFTNSNMAEIHSNGEVIQTVPAGEMVKAGGNGSLSAQALETLYPKKKEK